MANRTNPVHEGAREGRRTLDSLGRELRLARLVAGLTQQQVATALGCSKAEISRREHALVRTLGVAEAFRHAAAVGLKAWLRLFPAIRRPLDAPQLDLLSRFRHRIGPGWRFDLEVPMPQPGDLRAADAVIAAAAGRCVVEAITRLVGIEAQTRAARLKARDLGVQRVILLVAATHANRRIIREAGPMLAEAFPIATAEALRTLARGRLPEADALILL
ncbi:MAG: helix-turn-helix domain-containing protein [Candidatus Limnocylindria bacterium]